MLTTLTLPNDFYLLLFNGFPMDQLDFGPVSHCVFLDSDLLSRSTFYLFLKNFPSYTRRAMQPYKDGKGTAWSLSFPIVRQRVEDLPALSGHQLVLCGVFTFLLLAPVSNPPV